MSGPSLIGPAARGCGCRRPGSRSPSWPIVIPDDLRLHAGAAEPADHQRQRAVPGAERAPPARHRLPRPGRAQPADGRHPAVGADRPRGGRHRAGARRAARHRHRLPGPVVRLRRQPGRRRADDPAVHLLRGRGHRRARQRPGPGHVPVGILLAPGFFRVTRAATLEHARAQYVEAAELLGASKLHVIRVHVLRKVLPNIAVTTAHDGGGALLAVSFLTFLGIGVQPPAPTWGGVLSSDLDYLSQAPWAPFIPGALIADHRRRAERAGRRVPRPQRRGHAAAGRPGHPDPLHPDRSTNPAGRRLPGKPPPTRYCTSMTCTSACTTGRPPRCAASR